jgi:hypothetical protein
MHPIEIEPAATNSPLHYCIDNTLEMACTKGGENRSAC